MTSLHISIEGTTKLKNKIRRTRTLLEEEAEKIVKDLADMTVASAQALAPKDLGDGARGIHANVSGLSAEISVNDFYMVVMELGRRQGAKAPPAEALVGWASRHGFDRREVYVLARSIGRRGIVGRRYLERAARLTSKTMEARTKLVAIKLENSWSGN